MLQDEDIDAVFIKRALESFTSSVQTIRDSDQLQESSGTVRQRTTLTEEAKQRLSEELITSSYLSQRSPASRRQFVVTSTQSVSVLPVFLEKSVIEPLPVGLSFWFLTPRLF
ncbi:unnamed protein product [Boreogadus saida]